jgi:hypothetical protein
MVRRVVVVVVVKINPCERVCGLESGVRNQNKKKRTEASACRPHTCVVEQSVFISEGKVEQMDTSAEKKQRH